VLALHPPLTDERVSNVTAGEKRCTASGREKCGRRCGESR
jgi:hypothetical protein